MRSWVKAAAAALAVLISPVAGAEPYVLLEPVRGTDGRPLTRPGPGGADLPVLKRSADSPVAQAALRVLATGFSARLPAIDAAAREAARTKPSCPGLPQAVYVLLSDEDGGYARQGFFVEDGAPASLCEDHFIDITADAGSVADGAFEEVLAHEWGHVLLRRLWGPVPPTPSRKFHSVRTVTDPVTAFDEGLGAHLQPLSARMTATPGYRARVDGTAPPVPADLWFSRQETWMRQALVPQNRFVFEKIVTAGHSDAYRRWLADEASADMDPCRLKSGDQMVASEGVVASFLYKWLAGDAERVEARYRQLVSVLAAMGTWPRDDAPVIAFVRAWGAAFPDERDGITRLFLSVTHGATASREARALDERVACAGASGEIEAFLEARGRSRAAQDRLAAEVLAGRVALDAALGPGLWIANPAVKTGAAPWMGKRDLPVVVDLNTAREAELELAFSGTPLAGSAARIVEARQAGPFSGAGDLAARAGLRGEEPAALAAAEEHARRIGPATRR